MNKESDMTHPSLNKQSTIDYVMSLTPVGMRDGRDNVVKLMKIMGNPQDTLQVFHITGSNGKGSVCQMISQVLWKSFGKKVGLFTSPHFIHINERFQINGKMISDTDLEKYYQKVLHLAEKYKIPLSFFEIQVVVMVLYFVDKKVEYAVVEVGLGGTYDGTNIFHHPLACFITSITLEHTHVLGKTRESILRNKLGIIKNQTHLYTPIKHKLVQETCKKVGTYLHMVEMPQKKLTNLPGKHQQRNASMVLAALKNIGFNGNTIQAGLKNISNPGRFEWLSPTIIVDTANNKENIKILSQMIQEIAKGKKIQTFFGTTQTDSNYAAELAKIIPAEKRILVDGFCDRALSVSSYSHLVKNNGIIDISTGSGKDSFYELNTQNGRNTINLIYGSFYLVGYIMSMSMHKSFTSEQ
ncbi:hypothetical protein KA050_01670 [Candidatus Gracilibacteria bacterium]|nr:hypothetical protein [Candidatus Gracilibacteria bacterium]